MMRTLLKLLGIVLGAAAVLAAVAVAALYFVSERRIDRRYEVALEDIALPADAGAIERGAHVAIVRGCTACHGTELAGKAFVDDAMLGRVYAPNLTPAGHGAHLMPADWERALRHGIGHDGRSLLIMPAVELKGLSDSDLGDLIVYMQSVKPVEQSWPAPRVGPVGRMLLVLDEADIVPAERIDHGAPHAPAPAVAATPEYGGYLASSCTGCHKEDFAGGPMPGEKNVVAANLTMDEPTGLGRWSEADFVKTLRTGARPDGSALNGGMPWQITAQMTDVELSAIWNYLKTLPVLPEGTG
jgi:cytochrome c553